MRARRHSSIWSVLSLAAYLLAVGLGVVDVAQYGTGEHDHHGQPCQVHHFIGLSDALDMPSGAALITPTRAVALSFQYEVAALSAADFLSYKSRDPPAFFIS